MGLMLHGLLPIAPAALLYIVLFILFLFGTFRMNLACNLAMGSPSADLLMEAAASYGKFPESEGIRWQRDAISYLLGCSLSRPTQMLSCVTNTNTKLRDTLPLPGVQGGYRVGESDVEPWPKWTYVS